MRVLRIIVANRQRLILAIIMATVFGCCLHMAYFYGLSSHETARDFCHIDRLFWPDESNGMLSNFLHELLWLTSSQLLSGLWSTIYLDYHLTDLYTRLPIIVLSQVVLLLTYRLGNALADKAASRLSWGLMGALMLSVNAAFLALSFHLRFYMFNMVMVLMATFALLRLCHERNWRWLCIYQLSIWGCCASMLLSIILVVPHLLYFVLTSHERRTAYKQGALILLLTLGFLGLLIYHDPTGYSRFNYSTTHDSFSLFLCNGDMGSRYAHPFLAEWHQNWGGFANWGKPRQLLAGLTILALFLLVWQIAADEANGSRQCQANVSYASRWISWLCPVITLWAVLFYEIFSDVAKNICIAPNYSWILPFWSIAMAQVLCRWRIFRYFFLLVIINATPYTHTSMLVNGASETDNLRTMMAYRQTNEPILFPLYTLELDHYLRLLDISDNDLRNANQFNIVRQVRDSACPMVVEHQRIVACLQALQSCSRSRPLRLWLVSYDQEPTAEKLRGWLNKQNRLDQVEYLTTKDYISELYMVTLLPSVRGTSVTRRHAPTPLRGNSALKYLQRCR